MDEELAHQSLLRVRDLIDAWGRIYEQRWGFGGAVERPDLDGRVTAGIDAVRARTRFARDIVIAMDELELAAEIEEYEEGAYGPHPFTQARTAIVEAIAVLGQREELARIVGPVGPQLSASELHHNVWSAAAALWDGGHVREAVQTAATALEGYLQTYAGPGASGTELAELFSKSEPKPGSPRLRFRGLEPGSKTWISAQEGAAFLVRGAFLSVRNLVSHPGWPAPTQSEGLEMLAVLSRVARLVDECDLVECE